jgi:hypothetical protein
MLGRWINIRCGACTQKGEIMNLTPILTAISTMSGPELEQIRQAVERRRETLAQSTLVERRSFANGILQLEYRTNPKTGTKRGPYWYFQLAEQQQRATEAGRTLTQESVSAYMDFINSMFSTAQLGGQAAQRGVQEAQRGTRETQSTATEVPPESQEGTAELPLEDYDSLTVEQISERLDDLSAEQIRQLRAYEAENRNRSTLLRRLDERIEP